MANSILRDYNFKEKKQNSKALCTDFGCFSLQMLHQDCLYYRATRVGKDSSCTYGPDIFPIVSIVTL